LRPWPPGSVDLILLSEMVYYLTPAEVEELSRRIALSALTDAHCLLVNWTAATESPGHGPEAAQVLAKALGAIRAPTSCERSDHGEYVSDHLVL